MDQGEGVPGTLWRPGTLPRFAPLLVHDEWSYFLGLEGPEEEACAAAQAIRVGGPILGPAFFAAVEERGRIFAVLAEEFWEVYSREQEWLSHLAREWRGRPVDSSSWVDW